MHTSTFLKGLLAAFVVSLAGDYLWHSVLFMDFYDTKLQAINGAAVPEFSGFMLALELLAAFTATYVVLAAAKKRTMAEAAFHGGLVGFAIAGAINFLNHSIFPGWDTTLVAVDVAFGIVLGAVSGMAIWLATGKLR